LHRGVWFRAGTGVYRGRFTGRRSRARASRYNSL